MILSASRRYLQPESCHATAEAVSHAASRASISGVHSAAERIHSNEQCICIHTQQNRALRGFYRQAVGIFSPSPGMQQRMLSSRASLSGVHSAAVRIHSNEQCICIHTQQNRALRGFYRQAVGICSSSRCMQHFKIFRMQRAEPPHLESIAQEDESIAMSIVFAFMRSRTEHSDDWIG